MSQSPLIGRGSNLPGNLDHFSLAQEDDDIIYGRDDDFRSITGSQPAFGLPSSSRATSRQPNNKDFEMFGPAAAVDTQTAGTSQWVRQALDHESNNFFEYVKNSIDERAVDELSQEGQGAGFVTFGELFEEDRDTAVVAAQAFYHILTLATKKRVWVEQPDGDEVLGGEIRVGITV
jgi:meiotic recombination protein REC8, fungi type